MSETKFIPTTEVVTVENYPYGYHHRTTLFDSVEFFPKKGYRHVTQTINPKTGGKNKEKKGVYHPLLLRYYDEKGHIKIWVNSSNGDESINKGFKFIGEHYDLFTNEEKDYIRIHFIGSLALSWKCTIVYTKVPKEIADSVYKPLINRLKENTDLSNIYSDLFIDEKELKKGEHGPVEMMTVASFEIK